MDLRAPARVKPRLPAPLTPAVLDNRQVCLFGHDRRQANVSDDFSPALTDYPNDPADISAEYGRSRVDERVRFVTSGVFRFHVLETASQSLV